MIRSKMIREARERDQPAPVMVVGTAPSTTFVTVPQQPAVMPQSGYLPSYNEAFVASGPGGYHAGYLMPAGVYQNLYYIQPAPPPHEAKAHSINRPKRLNINMHIIHSDNKFLI